MPDDTPDDTGGTPAIHARRRRQVVVLGVLLPLLAASVLIWATTGRSDHIDRIPVAIVNNDTILTDPQPMAAGRSLTASLTHPSSPQHNLQWLLSDSSDAQAGLRDGSFYAVLTIPSDFSAAIVSSGTDKPKRGQLTLVSNGAASTTVPYISRQVAVAASTSLGNQTTQGYLKNVYGGFNTLADNSSKAADNASQLAGGTSQLSSGAAQLDQGATSLASSLDQLSSGATSLASGTRSVDSGAQQVASGTGGLATGAGQLHASAVQLAGASRTLAGRSAGLAGASRTVARGATGVGLAVHGLAAGQRLLTARLAALDTTCGAGLRTRVFCARLSSILAQSQRLAAASTGLQMPADRVAAGTQQVASGAGALTRGSRQLAAGNQELAGASGRLSSSAARLHSGASSVATGADGLVSGADQLSTGAGSAASAGTSVASGSSQLASSAGQTNSGAQSLSSGLATSAKQSPTYSTQQQDALAPVVSEPVQLSSSVQHTSHGNGWLVAVVLAVVLWLAVLVAAVGLDLDGVRRNALAPVTSRRLALAQAVPVLGLATLQAAAVIAALLVLHPAPAALVPLVLLTLLAALTFSLLALALRVGFGRTGVLVFVLLLVLQLAASGNVIPLETAPSVLQTLNGLLPLTAYVNGASQLVSGGQVGSLVLATLVIVVWAAVSALALGPGIKRRRGLGAVRRGGLARA